MSGPTIGSAPQPTRDRIVTAIVALVYLVLLALDIVVFLLLPGGSWQERGSFLLQAVGLFGLAIGFSSASKLSDDFPSLLDRMTSPNLRDFLSGSLDFASLVLLSLRQILSGLLYSKHWYTALPFILVWLIASLLMFAALVAYLILVVPLAYIPFAIVSMPLDLIAESPDSVKVSAGDEHVDLHDLFIQHKVTLRGFLVGSIATLFSFLTLGTALY